MALTPTTRGGLTKFRGVPRGAGIALVAPASPFEPRELEAGLAELRRLGFEPLVDEDAFDRHPIVAGTPERRAAQLMRAIADDRTAAVVAIRGGYGSAELLPWLDADAIARARKAIVGYSDITSLHAYLHTHARVTSVHGAMIDGRLSRGEEAYDPRSFVASLGPTPLGEQSSPALEVMRSGEASGAMFGGTLTQLAASLGTPYAFDPPAGYVLFCEEVGERPYRLRRLLTQLAHAGRLSGASAVVVGALERCDEPGGGITGREVIAEFFDAFPGPVLFGFPSGHTVVPFVSIPLGVEVRVVAAPHRPRVIFEEAAAE
ncbi:MAG: LD-carboxypeptidase [Acidobacteria bacterium]|nr:LD-carboxypeptidase [Acidobacteriota bacterium]